MHTCIIVDDNELARSAIRQAIGNTSLPLEIIGEADSVVSGAKLLRAVRPAIVFLDIDLGDGLGFDILDIVPDTGARVIFTTASDAYALRAFGYAAVDYLLKPVSVEALSTAVDRALNKASFSMEQRELIDEARTDKAPERLALHTSDEIRVVDLSDIVRLEASGNYTHFFFADGGKLLVSKTLKDYAKMLGSDSYLRTHQSHLVNIKYVKAYVKTEGGYILMKDQSIIPVSVRKKPVVVDRLSQL
jgi:two-component system LytT family response regulator